MTATPLPSWTVIAFTGHRNLDHPEIVAQGLSHAVNLIALQHPRLAGISSAASGSDTLFAEEMLRRDCPLTIILPFPCEQFQQDFEGNEPAWQRVLDLMKKASVETLPAPTPQHGCAEPSLTAATRAERTKEQKEATDAAYMDAGYRTVDRADVLIAVWDQKPARGFGGTAFVVEYARALNRPIVIVDPETGRLIKERLDEPAVADTPGGGEAMHPPATVLDPIEDPRRVVTEYFTQIKDEARKHGPKTRFLVRLCLQLYMAASALGFANLAFETHGPVRWILSAASFMTIFVASVLMFFFEKNHERWLECRVNAEVCRSFLATWDIRRHASALHQPRPAIPGVNRLFSDLRLLRQMDRSPLISLDEARSRYNIDRVESQIRYFKTELEKARTNLSQKKLAMKISTIAAVLMEGGVVVLSIFLKEPNWLTQSLEFFALTLPLLATALGLTLITQEAARRTARYDEMLGALKQLHRRLQASNTWDSLARVATEVEEELLQELVEWRSFIRFTRDVAHPG